MNPTIKWLYVQILKEHATVKSIVDHGDNTYTIVLSRPLRVTADLWHNVYGHILLKNIH